MSEIKRMANFRTEVVVETKGQQFITWGKPYVMDMHMLFITRNGVEQQLDTYSEYDEFTIKFIEGYLQKDDIIGIYYIPTTLSLGDIKVVNSKKSLDYIVDVQYNEVVTCIEEKKIYIYKGHGWEEFIVGGGGEAPGDQIGFIPDIIQYLYDEFDNIKQAITIKNDITVTSSVYEYDELGNIVKETISEAGAEVRIKDYIYDDNGNIIRIEFSDV